MVVGINAIYDKSQVDDIFQSFLAQPRVQSALIGFNDATESSEATETDGSNPDNSSDTDSKPSVKRKRPRGSDSSQKKPRSENERKERRRLQNRMAAATSREKKKRFHAQLEGKVESMTAENLRLQAQVRMLIEENEKLRQSQSETPSNMSQSTLKSETNDDASSVNTPTFANLTLESAVGGDDGLGCLTDRVFCPGYAFAPGVPHSSAKGPVEFEGLEIPSAPKLLQRETSNCSDGFSGLFFTDAERTPSSCSQAHGLGEEPSIRDTWQLTWEL